MIQRVLAGYPWGALSCVGLILFLGVFLSAFFWVFRKGSYIFYQELRELPFSESNEVNQLEKLR